MRRKNPFLIFDNNKKHFLMFLGKFTPFEGHLGKEKKGTDMKS
jgi:hypothetical protein